VATDRPGLVSGRLRIGPGAVVVGAPATECTLCAKSAAVVRGQMNTGKGGGPNHHGVEPSFNLIRAKGAGARRRRDGRKYLVENFGQTAARRAHSVRHCPRLTRGLRRRVGGGASLRGRETGSLLRALMGHALGMGAPARCAATRAGALGGCRSPRP
jgi:hypothetical protein